MTNSVFSKRIEDTINARTKQAKPIIADKWIDTIFDTAFSNADSVVVKESWTDPRNIIYGPDAIACTSNEDMVSEYCIMTASVARFTNTKGLPVVIVGTRFGPVVIMREYSTLLGYYYTQRSSEAFRGSGYLNPEIPFTDFDTMKLLVGCEFGPPSEQRNIGHVLDHVYYEMLKVANNPLFGGARPA